MQITGDLNDGCSIMSMISRHECVRASRKAESEYFKKIFTFLLVAYETLSSVCQVSEILIFCRENKRTALRLR